MAALFPMLSSCLFVSVESDLQNQWIVCLLAAGARVGSMHIQALMFLHPKLKEYCFIDTHCVPGPHQVRLNE